MLFLLFFIFSFFFERVLILSGTHIMLPYLFFCYFGTCSWRRRILIILHKAIEMHLFSIGSVIMIIFYYYCYFKNLFDNYIFDYLFCFWQIALSQYIQYNQMN